MEVQLTTCLVRSPLASVNARIARLLEWKGGPQNDARNRTGRFSASPALVPALAAAFALVGSYNHLLLGTHEITEWLMK
jgi:hypothetical protein